MPQAGINHTVTPSLKSILQFSGDPAEGLRQGAQVLECLSSLIAECDDIEALTGDAREGFTVLLDCLRDTMRNGAAEIADCRKDGSTDPRSSDGAAGSQVYPRVGIRNDALHDEDHAEAPRRASA